MRRMSLHTLRDFGFGKVLYIRLKQLFEQYMHYIHDTYFLITLMNRWYKLRCLVLPFFWTHLIYITLEKSVLEDIIEEEVDNLIEHIDKNYLNQPIDVLRSLEFLGFDTKCDYLHLWSFPNLLLFNFFNQPSIRYHINRKFDPWL